MPVPRVVDLSELDDIEAEVSGKDPDLAGLERHAANLHAKGFDFTVEHGKVIAGARAAAETAVDFGKDRIRLGIVSDTHGGSKYEQQTALRAFYRYGDDEKVDAFLHLGDVTQGPDQMHRGMELEVHAHGAEAQVAYVKLVYPKSARKGVKTYVLGGNHDSSFAKNGGANVVRQIATDRPDMVYVGQDAAYLTIQGLRTYLIHPDGGGAYAKTYKLQKIAATLPLERRVALLLCGHWHNFAVTRERDTHALMLPCFQSQYPWLARKALHPDIGGLIVDLWLDDAGRLARIRHELVSFPVVENDWDHEASAAVSRAWSPEAAA